MIDLTRRIPILVILLTLGAAMCAARPGELVAAVPVACQAGPKPWVPDPSEYLVPDGELKSTFMHTKEMPGDLHGSAASFPVGAADLGLSAGLYVPSYYDPTLSWPVLIEGRSKGGAESALREFRTQAERHGFLLLTMEYLYFRGEPNGTFPVWTREGGGTVEERSRTVPEYLADIAVDEKNVLALMKDLAAKYSVEKRCVGVTGFLGAGLMAYRLPMAYPLMFTTGIARSGGFSDLMMPPVSARARELPFFVIFGDKEDFNTLRDSTAAIDFLNGRNFKRVTAERIPHSGVDSRPEITGNYFRSAVDETVGAERVAFDRAANVAGQCLDGELPKDILKPDGKPIDEAWVRDGLASFVDSHPKSAYLGRAKFLLARLDAEKLKDVRSAEQALWEFDKAPLGSDAAAPQALLYLTERFVDPKANPKDAKRLLAKIVARRAAPPAVVARAKQILAELDSRDSKEPKEKS